MKKRKSEIKEWLSALIIALVLVIIIRAFVFEAFTIPSSSMEKSLLVGDYILVSKIIYGPRLPITPLAFPFSQQKLPFTDKVNSYLDWLSFPYFRFPGFSKIKNNDNVVFNYPMEEEHPVDQRMHYIKRCVAIAGDTLEIKDAEVFINNKQTDVPENAQFGYHIKLNDKELEAEKLKKLGITEGGKTSNRGDFSFNLTPSIADSLKKFKNVDAININLERKNVYTDFIFPSNEKFPWNMDNLGPLVIPKAGDSVDLNLTKLSIYKRIISVYEHNELQIKNDSIFINDRYIFL